MTMTADEIQHRLAAYPDILAALQGAVVLWGEMRTMFSLLREHFPPGQWEATAREIDDNVTIFEAAIAKALTPRKGS